MFIFTKFSHYKQKITTLMSEEKNINNNYIFGNTKGFYKNKILLTAFLFLFVIFVTSSFLANKGLYGDAPGMYFIAQNTSKFYFSFNDDTARVFSFYLATIPYNIFFPIFSSANPLIKLSLFSTSYLVMSGILTAINFYAAKYTKRFDIAIYAVFVYSFFYLPGSIWTNREIFIAFPIWFMLLQFFVCKEKLGLIPRLIMLFCLIYSFESFESFVPLGIILFAASVLFAAKKDRNYKRKLIIGFSSLAASIYIVLKTLFVATKSYNLTNSSNEWLTHIKFACSHIFSSDFCISLFGFFLIYLALSKSLSKRHKTNFSIAGFFFLFLRMDYLNNTEINTCDFTLYTFLLFVIPLIFLAVIYETYSKRKILKSKQLMNFFTISLFIGICQFGYQTECNYRFYNEYFVPLKNVLNTSNRIIKKDPALVLEDFDKYDMSDMIYLDSILVQSANPDKKIDTILLDENSDVYYDAKTDTIHFRKYDFMFKTKTKDFDFTPIRNQLIKSKKTKQ